eukprot:433053-Lingulodinium_polyedra.AAC.1
MRFGEAGGWHRAHLAAAERRRSGRARPCRQRHHARARAARWTWRARRQRRRHAGRCWRRLCG